jgi:fucose permease
VLILVAVLAIFVNGMVTTMLGTILPDLSHRLRLSPTRNGTIAFSQALGLMVASIGVGPLLDNQNNKLGLILGLAFIAIALFALPRSPGFHGIVFLLFLLGMGSGIVITAANTMVSAIIVTNRATALNLLNLFFCLGALATPFISANLFHKNWRRLSYALATFTVVVIVIQAVTRTPAPIAAARFVLADAGPVLGRPLLFLLALFMFLYITCEVGIWNWLPRHLIAQGIPESRALNTLSMGFALGMLIGRAAVSQILILVPPVAVTLAASIAIAVTTFLMLRTTRPNHIFALAFLAGISVSPVFPTTLAMVANAFPHMSGTALGFVITCGWAGLAVSSRIIGAIAGSDPRRLKKALLLIPLSAVLMVGVNLAIWCAQR